MLPVCQRISGRAGTWPRPPQMLKWCAGCAQGAVIVGKTNTCEFGQWRFTSGRKQDPAPWARSQAGSSGKQCRPAGGRGLVAAAMADGAGVCASATSDPQPQRRMALDLATGRGVHRYHWSTGGRAYRRRRGRRPRRRPRPGTTPATCTGHRRMLLICWAPAQPCADHRVSVYLAFRDGAGFCRPPRGPHRRQRLSELATPSWPAIPACALVVEVSAPSHGAWLMGGP